MSYHRLRLTAIEAEQNDAAYAGLQRLQTSNEFNDLVTVLEQELVAERELYETMPASDFQRGQVVMLKKVIALMTGEKANE